MVTATSTALLFLVTFIISFANAAIIKPTIYNASGEYYIITTQASEPPTIICNASKSNVSACYISCSRFGCTNLNLTCTSNTCNIHCEEDSCESMNMASTSTQIDIYCYVYGCDKSNIKVSANSKLNMICDGSKACESSQLTISNLSYYTNITCDGELDSHSCSNLIISVPYHYQQNFISFNFNNNGDHSANAGSADNIIINCIGQSTCTEYTKGPIVSTALPIKTNNSGAYYIADNSYQYRWQHIICSESQNCYINCTTSESCYNSYIECQEGSNCYIYCDKNDGCSYAAIQSTDKTTTKIQCNYYHGEYWQNNFDWQEGCFYTTIQSNDAVTLTCSGTSASNSNGMYFGGCISTRMNCTSGFVDSCNLICPLDSCQPRIYIPSNFKNGFLTISGHVEDTTLICAEGSNQFEYDGTLKNYSPCMPWHGGNDIISCTDKTECSISCNQHQRTDNPYFDQYGCSYQTINASDVEKLSVICDGSGKSCKEMNILCGKNECAILCEECSSSIIHAFDTKMVNITAKESFPTQLTINATNAGSVIFRVPSNGDHEPYDIKIYAEHAQYVEVGDVISDSYVYAQYADRVTINCTSMMCTFVEPLEECINGCYRLTVDATHAGQVNYYCNNKNGCKNNGLYAQNSTELNITALSNNERATSDSNIVGPTMSENNLFFISKNTNLFCQDNGCANATFYAVNGLKDIDAIWNGTCECGDSVSDCIAEWRIYCGDYNETYSKYNGKCIDGNDNGCCTDDSAKIITAEFNYYYGNECPVKRHGGAMAEIIVVVVVIIVVGMCIFGCIWYIKTKKDKKKGKEEMLLSGQSSSIQ